MNIYEENLKLFQTMSPEIYRIVTEEEPNLYIDVEEAAEGNNCVIKTGQVSAYVHSIYNLEHEMKMMCKDLDGSERNIIVFGLGCGHIIQHLRDNYKNLERIIIVEPTLQTFKYMMERVWLKELLVGLNVAFIINQKADFMSRVVANYFEKNRDIKIIYNLNYFVAFNDYYKKMISEVTEHVLKLRTNYGVSKGLTDLWTINSFANWEYCNDGISLIKDYFKDRTVVIVGAGPSLEKNIHLINKLKDKAIVIAIGSAIKILDSRGITPHFRMAYDGSPTEMQAFDGIDTKSAPLIFSTKLFFKAVHAYEGTKLQMSLDRDQIDRFLDKKKGVVNPYVVTSGSSILVCALNMALLLGSRRIVLMGIDMATKGNRIYAGGLNNNIGDVTITSYAYMEATDIYGEKVYVHKGLYTALLNIEEVIQQNPGIDFIDATEGGVAKKGMRIMKLKEVIDQVLQYDSMIDKISYEIDERVKGISQKNPDIEQYLPIMISEFDRVNQIIDKVIKNVKKIKKNAEKGLSKEKAVKEILGLDNFYKQMGEIDVFSMWIYNALYMILKGIDVAHAYNGDDMGKKYESELNKILGKTAEIESYVRNSLAFCNSIKRGTLLEELKNV